MTRDTLRRIAIASAAGAAGLLVHWLVVMPPGMQVWPWRFLTLPVALTLGPLYGLLATFIAGAPLVVLRPIALVILSAEVLVIGIATRRGFSTKIAGLLFWAAFALNIAFNPRSSRRSSNRRSGRTHSSRY
jgi:hypothetical protein